MKLRTLWVFSTLAVLILCLAGPVSIQAQEAGTPDLGEYLLFWQLAGDKSLPSCQPLSETDLRTPSSCGEPTVSARIEISASQVQELVAPPSCGEPMVSIDSGRPTCSSNPENPVSENPGCAAANTASEAPPDLLWSALLDLQASGRLVILDRLPDQSALRLMADAEVATKLRDHPETAQLVLVAPITRVEPPSSEQASGQTDLLSEAAPAFITSTVPITDVMASHSEAVTAEPLGQVATYSWVNNQGPNPPITYNWVEISGTGTVVAQGDDTYTEVQLGFPFSFYGTTYTSAFVSSNGFLSFGSGNSSFLQHGHPELGRP